MTKSTKFPLSVQPGERRRKGPRPGMMHLDRRASSLLQSHVSEGPDDELLTTPQLANWFGTTTQKVEGDRRKGIGPPFVQMAGRDIRYSRGTVRKWLEQRVRQCTAEYTRRAEMKKRKS